MGVVTLFYLEAAYCKLVLESGDASKDQVPNSFSKYNVQYSMFKNEKLPYFYESFNFLNQLFHRRFFRIEFTYVELASYIVK
jgi:hypothetical protein